MNSELKERKKELDKELKHIVRVIVKEYSPQKIILFGSLAKGKVYENSDIDLIIVKSTKKGPWERMKEVDKFIGHNLPVDVLVYTPQEIKQRLLLNDSFVREFNNYGKVIYNNA